MRTRATTALVVAAAGLVAAAAVASSIGGDDDGRRSASTPPTTTTTAVVGRRDGGPSSGLDALPSARPRALRGRVILGDRPPDPACRTRTLDLATMRVGGPAGLPGGCIVAASPDGRFLLVLGLGPGGAPIALRLVRVPGGDAVAVLPTAGIVTAPAVGRDGRVVACRRNGGDGVAATVTPGRGTVEQPGCPVAIGAAGVLRVVQRTGPEVVDERGRVLDAERLMTAGLLPPYALAVTPDGRHLAVGGFDPRVGPVAVVARAATGAVVRRVTTPGTEVLDVRVAPGGGAVAIRTPTPGGTAGWTLLRTDAPITATRIGPEPLLDVAFSPDGGHVVVATGAHVVVLDTRTFGPTARLPGRARSVIWTATPRAR